MNQKLTVSHCPKCQSSHFIKAGFACGKQRYKCKDCNHYFTVMRKSTKKSDEIKQMAIDMYFKGLGFRAIGRLLGISYGTVHYWVKQLDEQRQTKSNDTQAVNIVELDKNHSNAESVKT